MSAHEPEPTRRAELLDDDLRAEIELLSEVIAEVGHRQGPLEPDELDRILGVANEESPQGPPASRTAQSTANAPFRRDP